MEQLIGILGILIVFGLIIGFHEFGHFIVAKLTGVGVIEFSIGFGPALFSKKYRGTQYSIRMIPLGGYVRMVGEDTEEERGMPGNFNERPFYAKFATLFAGAFMNFVLAFIVFTIVFAAIGRPLPGKTVYIAGVTPFSPADKAGLKAEDVIVEINGVRNITSPDQAVDAIRNGKPPVRLVVERSGKQHAFSVQPKKLRTADPVAGGWLYRMREYYGIGIVPDNTSGTWEREHFGTAVVNSAQHVALRIKDAIAQVASLVTGSIKPKEISSFLGIGKISYGAAQGAVKSHGGLATYLGLIGALSIYIGFFNLLPIPMLDGSRMLFVTIEAIIRKPFDKKKEALVHMVGLALLLALVVYATFNDILRFAGKG
ncbi:MAG: M50 family metallopeptidase [Armatimonadota bacterium]